MLTAMTTICLHAGEQDESPTVVDEYSSVGFEGQTLSIPEGIRVIGEGAFAGSTIETVVFPSTLDSIGPYAFAGCRLLREVSLPSDVKHVGRNAFSGCNSLESVTFSAGLQTIGTEAFQSAAVKTADLSECGQLKSIGAWAFADCREMGAMKLPMSAGIIIGEGVFMGCSSLKNIIVPAIGAIPAYAFAGCHEADLSGLIWYNPLDSIGEYAFSGNLATDTISLPSGMEYLGDHAMERMASLRHLDVAALDKVPHTGDNVWEGVDQPNVSLLTAPEMAEKFASAPQWQEFHIGLTTSDNSTELPPNPVTIAAGSGRLYVSSTCGDICQVEIFDTKGVLMSHYRTNAPELTTDISGLQSGVYIIRVDVPGAAPQSFTFIK
ncbi:MAG: leucine-rich repeat protein [Muribaculum sp.]|nr:leucine-rich repeat protein [Muribaculum sp.]